jgi:hypothetical protein
MDPYLEGEMWQEFHETFASEIRNQLLSKLPPRYVALLAKRYVVGNTAPPKRFGEAAVAYGEAPFGEAPFGEAPFGEAPFGEAPFGEAPVLELISPLEERIPIPSIEVYEVYEVRDNADRRLVTAIEILSPVNKHGAGWQEYNEKRRALLNTQTHLVELDLLRGGERIELAGKWVAAPYYIFLSRWQRRPITQAYPVALRQRLPSVPVPLLPPDDDVMLDVQAAVDACFKLVRYERLLNYDEPPPPPEFGDDDLAWIQERARAAA